MKQFFQDVKNSFLLSAAVSIILGIVLIVYPVKTSLLICYIAGALLLFGGVVALIRYKPRRTVFLPLRSVRCPGTDSVRLLRYL